MAKAGRGSDQFPLRLPDGLRDRVKRHAEANGRSMNSEIVSLLEQGLFEADMAMMNAGMLPLREVTPLDWKIINSARSESSRLAEEFHAATEEPQISLFGDDEEQADGNFYVLSKEVDVEALSRVIQEETSKAMNKALERLGLKREKLNLRNKSQNT